MAEGGGEEDGVHAERQRGIGASSCRAPDYYGVLVPPAAGRGASRLAALRPTASFLRPPSAVRHPPSYLYRRPPRITNTTCRSAPMSRDGSPLTAMRSAA